MTPSLPAPTPTPGIWARVMGSGTSRRVFPPGLGLLGKNLSYSEPRFQMGALGTGGRGSVLTVRGSPGVRSEVSTSHSMEGKNLMCLHPGAQDHWKSSQSLPSRVSTDGVRRREEGGEVSANRSRRRKCGHWWGQRCPQGEGAGPGGAGGGERPGLSRWASAWTKIDGQGW